MLAQMVEVTGNWTDMLVYAYPIPIIIALLTGVLQPKHVNDRTRNEADSLADDLRRTREELLLSRGRLHGSLRSLPASSSTPPDTFVVKNARGDVCIEYTSPMPGEPTMCLLDHSHGKPCETCAVAYRNRKINAIAAASTTRPAPDPYTPFDPDLAQIEAIEPIFVMDDQLKWKKAL